MVRYFSPAIRVTIMNAASQRTDFPAAQVQSHMGLILLQSLDLCQSTEVKDQILFSKVHTELIMMLKKQNHKNLRALFDLNLRPYLGSVAKRFHGFQKGLSRKAWELFSSLILCVLSWVLQAHLLPLLCKMTLGSFRIGTMLWFCCQTVVPECGGHYIMLVSLGTVCIPGGGTFETSKGWHGYPLSSGP